MLDSGEADSEGTLVCTMFARGHSCDPKESKQEEAE